VQFISKGLIRSLNVMKKSGSRTISPRFGSFPTICQTSLSSR